ncbi:H-NS family nucleoid-associated regulatory protein [Falsirhodobacter halotolerans]|uniref:H-NS histone family protein n=1 Tax=Falsirhodobacter halotolerans TaxID=1146892 RepID=UPI001FCFA01D|nr:H-NS histone family protein [Falsirhodobacter halotolerans]MCJ8141182.1 H-NS histone family protein [Falsirhodobacter halotolerans]
MEPELNDLSLAELKALDKKIGKAIATFEARHKKRLFDVLQNVAREQGVSMDELIDAAQSGNARPGLPARYANPDNPNDTWSGRGRKPQWYSAAIERGMEPKELAI